VAILDWLFARGVTPKRAPARAAPVVSEERPVAGKYQLLHKYLRDRYANRVVLTFSEIEDLLGFALPDLARVQLAWWNSGEFGGTPSIQSFAWMLAGRTAAPNLSAKNVVFDREE